MQSVVLPLVLALVLTGMLRLAGGSRVGPRVAALAIVVAFLAAFSLISGVPSFPPRASTEKLFYVAVCAGGAGLVLELVNAPRVAGLVMAVLAPLLAAGWMGWPLVRSMGGVTYLMAAGAAAWGMVALLRLVADQGDGRSARHAKAKRHRGGLAPAVVLLAAAIAVAAIAYRGATLSVALYGAALAAALGGYVLWNWPVVRFPATEPVTIGVGATLAALVSLLVFYTTASRIALAVVLSVFFVVPLVHRVAGKRYRESGALEAVIVLLVCIPLVLAAVVIAWVGEGGEPGY